MCVFNIRNAFQKAEEGRKKFKLYKVYHVIYPEGAAEEERAVIIKKVFTNMKKINWKQKTPKQ